MQENSRFSRNPFSRVFLLTVLTSFRTGERMKSFPLPRHGRGGHGQGQSPGGCDLRMTSLLLILTLLTLLLPSPVSGYGYQGVIEACHSGETTFGTTNCSFPTDVNSYDREACCWFIFSFGDVPSRWGCSSRDEGDYWDLCKGDDNACQRYEKDSFGKSVRCVCTSPVCNHPLGWAKDPIFKQWKRHPANRKWKDPPKEGEETTPTPPTATTDGDGYGGVARTGGRGDLATVAALLVIIAALSRYQLSSLFLFVTFGATFLLLPSTVSGELQTRVDLTCLSSSNATDDWGDRHCGEEVETCCYYIFQEVPNWGCANPSTCERRYDEDELGYTNCREQWDGPDRPPALLCHCNRNSCNHHDDEWEGDVLFQRWKREREDEATTLDGAGGTTPTTKDPNENSGSVELRGTKGFQTTVIALLKALFDIIF